MKEKDVNEQYERVLGKITEYLKTSQVESKKFSEKKFKEWFYYRFEKCNILFDWKMIYRMWFVYSQHLTKDGDHFMLIVGPEGLGKSTFAGQLCSWANPDVPMNEVFCHDAGSFLKQVREIAIRRKEDPSYDVVHPIIIDEGSLDLFSREAMKSSNRVMTKLFFTMRQLNCFVVVLIQDLWSVDSIVRTHRCKTLIQILERGVYKCMVGKSISLVNTFGQKEKRIASVKLPTNLFWHGKFSRHFPLCYDQTKYKKEKYDGFMNFLDDAITSTSNKVKYERMSKLAKELGVNHNVATGYVESGKWPGKKFGGRWLIERQFYEKAVRKAQNGGE